MLVQIHTNEKVIENFRGWDGQKWVRPVWSWDSKSECVSKLTRWNKLVFCMLAQIQKS